MEMRTVAVGMMLAGLVFGSSACSSKTAGSPVINVAASRTIDLNASNKSVDDQLVGAMTCDDNGTMADCAESIKNITFTIRGTVPFVMNASNLKYVALAVSRTSSAGDALPAFCPKAVAGCGDIKMGDTVSISAKMEEEFSTHGEVPEVDKLKMPAFVVQSVSAQ